MKPYFVKFIVEEGFPEIGEYYQLKSHGSEIFKSGTFPQWTTIRMANKLVDKLSKLTPSGDVRKIKRVLCSKNIQVGDETFTPDFVKVKVIRWDKEYKNWEQNGGYRYESESIFKVLCEISLDAEFVKEGDEFGPGDFYLSHMMFEDGKWYICGSGWYRESLVNKDFKTPVKKVFVIKGPDGNFY